MTCLPSPSELKGTDIQIINASDETYITYHGGWVSSIDFHVQVSSFIGDWATVVFTGVNIQVVGTFDPGYALYFGIDGDHNDPDDSKECTGDDGTQENTPLFDTVALELFSGAHTLFITNDGGTISLHHFVVFASRDSETDSERSTSASHSTPLMSMSNTGTSTSASTPSASVITGNGAGASLPSGTPFSTIANPQKTASNYTEVSSINGTPSTIVIQTTIEVQKAQSSPAGLSRGVLAGAVVGGVLLSLLLVGVGLYWRGRCNRLRETAKLDIKPDTMTVGETTQAIDHHDLNPTTEPVSLGPSLMGLRSRKHLFPGPRGPAFSPPDQEEEEDSSERESDLTGPHFSSTVVEVSLVSDDGPSRAVADVDHQAMATSIDTEGKRNAQATSPDIRSQPSESPPGSTSAGEPEGHARGSAFVTGGEATTGRGDVPVRRVRIEEDSGIRLAGGRLGEAGGEEGSGEWEVLPPPYREF